MESYGIFQGGGAKGYAHVGALAAAEERSISFRLVAGTSAGAIIASLVACGFKSTELYDPMKPEGARGVLEVDSPFDIIGEQHQQELEFARQDIERWWTTDTQGKLLKKTKKAANAALLMIRYRQILAQLLNSYGILPTQGIEAWLERLYRDRLGIDRQVLFSDLPIPLKVIAADVIAGDMVVFGEAEHGHVSVARAVTASACYPFVFQPVSLIEGKHVDGGLVSNLPVWIFDAERSRSVDYRPTFGFRLASDLLSPSLVEPKGMPSFMWRMVQTMQAGTRQLEERRIDDYHAIDLIADIGTLSLDQVAAEAPALIAKGKECVDTYFVSRLGPRNPLHMTQVLRVVLNVLDRRFGWMGVRSRACVLLAEPDGLHARTAYSARMDHDADDRLRVRIDGGGVGSSIRLREPVYVDLNDREPRQFGLDKYEFGSRPSEIRQFYSIPIFLDTAEWAKGNPDSRAKPEACLVIDLGRDFASPLADPIEQDLFALVSILVGEEIRSLRILGEQEVSDTTPENLTGPAWTTSGPRSLCRVSRRKVRSLKIDRVAENLIRSLKRLSE